MASELDFIKAKEEVEGELLSKDGVEGVGIGKDDDDNDVFVVYTSKKNVSGLGESVETKLAGSVKLKVINSGKFFANGNPEHPLLEDKSFAESNVLPFDTRGRIRPVPGGFSISHDQLFTAGSSGLILALRTNSGNLKPVLFGNQHVMTHNNTVPPWWPTLQPGRNDGGRPSNDRIGELSVAFTIAPQGENRDNIVDCAMAMADSPFDLSGYYPDIGTIDSVWRNFRYGDTECYKVGRTTGRVKGRVESWYATKIVDYGSYGGLGQVVFKYTTVVKGSSPVSLPGDSGSCWVQPDSNGHYAYAGINFAAPSNGLRSISFEFNWIKRVFEEENMPLYIWKWGGPIELGVIGEAKEEEDNKMNSEHMILSDYMRSIKM